MQERELLRTSWRSAEGFDENLWNDFEARYGSRCFSYSDAREAIETEGAYTQVYLKVKRFGLDRLWVELLLSDESHQVYRVTPFFNAEVVSLQESLDKRQLPPIDKIEWSDQTRQFGDAVRAFFRLTGAEALPALLDPARTEPLTLVPFAQRIVFCLRLRLCKNKARVRRRFPVGRQQLPARLASLFPSEWRPRQCPNLAASDDEAGRLHPAPRWSVDIVSRCSETRDGRTFRKKRIAFPVIWRLLSAEI